MGFFLPSFNAAAAPPDLTEPVIGPAKGRTRRLGHPPKTRWDRGTHSPNTNSIVALVWPLSSGERAILARPTGPMPEAMAMYCFPPTA